MPPMTGVRERWRSLVLSIVSRPLSLAAAGALADECQRRGPRDRAAFAPLEALGRIDPRRDRPLVGLRARRRR